MARSRIRLILQHDSMQCGVACLCMIANCFGRRCSITQVEKVCQATVEGVSLKGISDGAKYFGLKSIALKTDPDQLIGMPLPAILHWDQNHFVVLHKISRNGTRFHIADPAKGKIHYSHEDLRIHWISTKENGKERGIGMFFEPDESYTHTHDSQESWTKAFNFILQYVKEYRRYFLHILIGLLIGCLLQLIMPFLTQSIVDIGIKHKDIGFIWLVLLGELMIVVGATVTNFIRKWFLLHISMRVNISLVSDFFIKLLKLPMSFFDTKLMGDMIQRIGDHSRIQNFLTGEFLNILFSLITIIVFGIVLVIYNRIIFTIFLIGSIVYGVWVAMFLNKRKVLDYELFDRQAHNQNVTYQFVTCMQEIKLQGCERRRRWEWEDSQADLFSIRMKSLKLEQTQEAGSLFIEQIKNILITVLAANAVINGSMTLGAMLAVQYVIGQLNSPIDQMMRFVYSLQDVKLSLERINEIHKGKNEEDARSCITAFPGPHIIKLKNVEFKYDIHSPSKTLDGISIEIPEGKVTAIVGASGSGKTTLVKLMLGYYPASQGTITIADREIEAFSLKWWRSRCGAVMQDGIIFSDTIARNIATNDEMIDIGRLEEAARTACIHEFVMGLPLKYNTKIGRDGAGLSQGQRQRILIARAVYRNPDFIFLDEATNSLDANNEKAIVRNLEDFYKGRTVVIVAHRLSTVKNADCIVVLDKGRVVEYGNHASLIGEKGAYYNLIKNQLELGK